MAGAAPGTTFGVDFILSGSWSSCSSQTASLSFLLAENAGCSLQTLQAVRNLPNRLLELPAVAGQVLPFLLARNCRMLPFQTLQTLRNLTNRLLELPNYRLWQAKAFLFSGPKLPDAPFKRFKPCETFPIGSWSCQLWQASETCETGSWSCQLWQAKSFRCYWPETAGCSLHEQTLQILRNFQPGSWSCQLWQAKSFLFYWPETTGCSLFKRFKPSETFQTGSWSCQLWQAKSFLFYWPETAGSSLQTLHLANRLLVLHETCQTGSWSCQTIWAVAGHVCPFLLALNCQMLPSNAPNPPKPSKPALGAAKLWAVAGQVCLLYWPETADASFKCAKLSETCETACQRPCSPRARAALPPQTAEGGRWMPWCRKAGLQNRPKLHTLGPQILQRMRVRGQQAKLICNYGSDKLNVTLWKLYLHHFLISNMPTVSFQANLPCKTKWFTAKHDGAPSFFLKLVSFAFPHPITLLLTKGRLPQRVFWRPKTNRPWFNQDPLQQMTHFWQLYKI